MVILGRKIHVRKLMYTGVRVLIYAVFFLIGLLTMHAWVIYYSGTAGIKQINSVLPIYVIQKLNMPKFEAIYEHYQKKRAFKLEVPARMVDPFK